MHRSSTSVAKFVANVAGVKIPFASNDGPVVTSPVEAFAMPTVIFLTRAADADALNSA
jgi:hypothetical protein